MPPLIFYRRPEAVPAVHDAYSGSVHVGVISAFNLPGEPSRRRWSMRLGQPREYEGVGEDLNAAKDAMCEAWLAWCARAGVRVLGGDDR